MAGGGAFVGYDEDCGAVTVACGFAEEVDHDFPVEEIGVVGVSDGAASLDEFVDEGAGGGFEEGCDEVEVDDFDG